MITWFINEPTTLFVALFPWFVGAFLPLGILHNIFCICGLSSEVLIPKIAYGQSFLSCHQTFGGNSTSYDSIQKDNPVTVMANTKM